MRNFISYKNYKSFWNDFFQDDLINELCTNGIREEQLTGVFETCTELLDCRLPNKKKTTRVNVAPTSTNEVNKEIMTRPEMINRLPRFRSDKNNPIKTLEEWKTIIAS